MLPGLALDFAAGFNAITYTGLEISAADLAGPLGSKVVAIFRFNSATQRYERFTVGALAFLNSLDQVQTGDGLFLQTSGAFSSTLLILTPFGGTVDVALLSGSNLIAYTGGAVSLEQLLGELDGLTAAFAFDAVTQRWLGWRPPAPAATNQISELAGPTSLFLILGSSATLSFDT